MTEETEMQKQRKKQHKNTENSGGYIHFILYTSIYYYSVIYKTAGNQT